MFGNVAFNQQLNPSESQGVYHLFEAQMQVPLFSGFWIFRLFSLWWLSAVGACVCV